MPYPKRLFQIRIPKERIVEVCLALHELGYRWGGGPSLKDTHYSQPTGDTLYSLYDNQTVKYGSIHRTGVRLYEVDEFLQEFCGIEDDGNLNIESIL